MHFCVGTQGAIPTISGSGMGEKNEQFYTPGNVTDEETDIFDCQVCAKPPMTSADNHPSN